MTVSEYIFTFLQSKGIDTTYMVSGSSAMWLTDALCRNDKIKAICTHHEQAATMAADLYGRTRGIPGVALVTIGPGATNAITGVAEAYVDSSPLFVISGQASSKLLQYEISTGIRQHGTQSLNLEPMVSSITKYFAAVMKPETIRFHMEKAYHAAMEGRRGPVWIDVPVDIQNKQIPEVMEGFAEDKSVCPESDEALIDCALGKLEEAKRPLIIAGGGIAFEVLRAITDRLKIPVVTTRMGIDRIENDNPCYVGRIGAYGQRAAHFALQQADVILILGSRLSVSSIGYYPDRLGADAYKIQVDIDQRELDKQDVPINVKLCMTTEAFAKSLNQISAPQCGEWVSYCRRLQEKYPVVEAHYACCDPMNSYYFTDVLTQIVPEDSAIVVDTGSVCNVVSQTWEVKRGQRYLISGGLSCMGFWAGAIGCCGSGKPVIALSGDGSVSMNIQEFATLRYYNLPVKLFVYQNNGYMLIRHNQHNYMNDRFLGVGPDSGVQTPDYCKVAAAYGIPSVRISYGDDLNAKIMEVLHIDGPVICEVMLEQFGPLAPRIASKVMPDGSLKAAEFDDLAPFLSEEDKPEKCIPLERR